jgi:hypothetical protein
VVYPDSDGEPIADNTLQFNRIVLVKENLDVLFPDAFVGGDLLWYPVEGDPKTRIGPERERAAAAAARAEEERARADARAAKLRTLGVDPDQI